MSMLIARSCPIYFGRFCVGRSMSKDFDSLRQLLVSAEFDEHVAAAEEHMQNARDIYAEIDGDNHAEKVREGKVEIKEAQKELREAHAVLKKLSKELRELARGLKADVSDEDEEEVAEDDEDEADEEEESDDEDESDEDESEEEESDDEDESDDSDEDVE